MGQAIAARVGEEQDLDLAGIWTRDADLDAIVAVSDVVIDFSLPEGTERVVAAVMRHEKPLVCGVSGLSSEQMAQIDAAADVLPLVYDRNMSLGIAVLERCVREAVESLGQDFDVRIAETHHVHKKDAPSGTALKLGEAVAEARNEPDTGSIRYDVERRGEVPGDHEVILSSATERLCFSHSVTTRQVFADGALRAARWVVGQAPGRYLMRDVLFSG